MGLLKVTQWDGLEATELVLSTQHIVFYNSLSKMYLRDHPSIAKMKCVAVSMEGTQAGYEPHLVICESVNTFTQWVEATEQRGSWNMALPPVAAKES